MRPAFGAPPLLNELVRRGEYPAVLNFWNYAAPLKAQGYRELITVREMMLALGMQPATPLLGWAFSAKWAAAHSRIWTLGASYWPDQSMIFLRRSPTTRRR